MEQDKTSVFGRQLKVAMGIVIAAAVIWFLIEIRGILLPFALAFALSYVMAPLVDRLEGRGLSRPLSILVIFVIVFSGLILGLFKAGTKLTGEMLELSEQFLVQEEVVQELVIANKSDRAVSIENVRGLQYEGSPFSLAERALFPIEIGPGDQRPLRFRFAPTAPVPVERIINIASPSLNKPFALRLRGNGEYPERGSDDYRFWIEEAYADSIQIQALHFSAQGVDFGKAGPSIITRLSEEVGGLIVSYIPENVAEDLDISALIKEHGGTLAEKLLGGTTEVLGGVFSGITFAVIVPCVAFFMLKEGNRITRGLIELVPNSYFELCLNLLHQINGQIGGYIRGLILATTVVGTLSVSGLLVIGVPYALPVGILAGLANMIPFLGPLIGILSASVVALATGGGLEMVGHVVIVFAMIQLIDNVLIQPVVLAKSVDLHPLIVFFVVLAGGQLMGLMGMLIAVPMTGIFKVSGQSILEGIKRYRTQ